MSSRKGSSVGGDGSSEKSDGLGLTVETTEIVFQAVRGADGRIKGVRPISDVDVDADTLAEHASVAGPMLCYLHATAAAAKPKD